MSNMCDEEAELANWDPRRDDYHNPKSLIIGGDGPAANFVRTNNLARSKEVVKERPGLYVRNVPRTMTNDGILRLFSMHGKVLNAFIGNPSKGSAQQHKNNWAIVKVESTKDAMNMIQALNNAPPTNLRVELAMTDEERERRKQQKIEEEQHNQEMEKLVDSFNTRTTAQPSKNGTGTGRGRIPSFESSRPNAGSPRRPGSMANTSATSSLGKPLGAMNQSMAKPMITSITAKEGHESVEQPNDQEGSDLTKAGNASSANPKVVVEMSLGSVVVGYRKPRPCVLCNEGGKYRCSVCKAWYCSKICQVDDWYDHKNQCEPPPFLERADTSIYKIDDDDGNNEPLDVHQLLDNGSTNLSPQNLSTQNSVPMSKIQSDIYDTSNNMQKENHIASKLSQNQVTIVSDEPLKEIKESKQISSTPGGPVKEIQSSPIMKNSQITKALKKIDFNNLGFIENKQHVQDDVNNVASHGSKDAINSRDEPDFVKISTKKIPNSETNSGSIDHKHVEVNNDASQGNKQIYNSRDEADFVKISTKINPRPEIVASVKTINSSAYANKSDSVNDITDLSKKSKSDVINSRAPEKLSLSKEPNIPQHADEKLKINSNSKSDSVNNIKPISSVNSNATDLSIKSRPDAINGRVSEKLSLSKEPNISQHADEKTKTTSNTDIKNENVDLISRESSPFLFPSLCNEMDVEKSYMGIIFTNVDNHCHFTMSILNESTANTIMTCSEIIANAPQVPNFEVTNGTLIGAMFEHEWYRAYAIDKLDDGSIKVFFIDYGNTEVVKDVKPLPDGILSEAAGLIVIAKQHRNTSYSNPEKLKDIIKKDNSINFKVVGKKGTSMKVSLIDNNGDIIGTYILRPWYTSLEISPSLSRASSKSNIKVNITPDGSISSRTQSPVPTPVSKEIKESRAGTLGLVNGVSDEKKTNFGMQQINKSSHAESSAMEKQSTGARPKEKVTSSPSQEANQSRGVALKGKSVEMNGTDSLLKDITKEHVSIRQRLSMDPVATRKISSNETKFWASSLNSEKLEVGKSYDVIIVWTNLEDNCIWVQVHSESNVVAFEKMQSELNEFCEKGTPKWKDLSPGEVVGGQDGDVWYRCEVCEVLDGQVNVFFFDFGNSSTLSPDHIRKINPNMMKLQKMAVKIALKDLDLKQVEVQEKLLKCLGSKEYMKIRIESVNPMVASFLDDKMGLYKDLQEEISLDVENRLDEDLPAEDLQNIPGPSDTPTFKKMIKVDPPEVTQAPLPSSQSPQLPPTSPPSNAVDKPSGNKGCSLSEAFGRMKGVIQYENCPSEKLIVGERNRVIVMENNNPTQIMVIPADQEKLAYLMTVLQEEIRIHCESLPNQHYKPGNSEMCLAKFEEDGVWYRAACCQADVNTVSVIFVDFGNIAIVPHEDIRPMDPKFLKTPLMALHCQMTGIDIGRPEALHTPEVMAVFQELLPKNEEYEVMVKEKIANGMYSIDIPHVLGALKEQGLI